MMRLLTVVNASRFSRLADRWLNKMRASYFLLLIEMVYC
jgi:hypothetical protein